jgi:uncharacterized glyoxalase superfamily protein PhnB
MSELSYPTLCPYVFYEDTGAALDWLARAFGFRERLRTTNADGELAHVEMQVDDAVIMMGSSPEYKSPAHVGHVSVGMYVRVPDVDAHYQRAKAAGAAVQGEPTDQAYGERLYGAIDLEGHQWWFAQSVSS